MATKFTVAYCKDANNVGDIASNPLQYFLPNSEYNTVNLASLEKETYSSKSPLIVGGGGLIANQTFEDNLKTILEPADYFRLKKLKHQRWQLADRQNSQIYDDFQESWDNLFDKALQKLRKKSAPRMIWGAGHNNYDLEREVEYPEYLEEFDSIGMRDYGTGYQWVPCASCMHNAFDREYTIRNDVIWFEHKKQLIKNFGTDSIPRYVNSGNNIEHTIELLGSANIVLTNSYHGAYWATLLKKRVIVVNPWSTKFQFFKHEPVMCSKNQQWQTLIDQATVYDDALDECRAATRDYWDEIKQYR